MCDEYCVPSKRYRSSFQWYLKQIQAKRNISKSLQNIVNSQLIWAKAHMKVYMISIYQLKIIMVLRNIRKCYMNI